MLAGASSGIHVIALRSYLNPVALLSASFVYHLLLSLVVRAGPRLVVGQSAAGLARS